MSAAEDLARRVESQAMISARPGQLAELEQIASEVRALGADLERLRRATDHHCANTERELERLRPIEQRARDVREGPANWIEDDAYEIAEYILGETP